MNHSFLTVRGLDYSIDGTEILQMFLWKYRKALLSG